MIDEINVSNIALIEEGSIEPSDGLTAITGETGAGKTALLTSCKLLMGLRAEKTYVREGSSEAIVSGRFFVNENANIDLRDYENVLDVEDDSISNDGAEIVVQRRLTADGRTKIRINGQMASVGELADVIGSTIDLCSQHDQQMLVKPQMQREWLDNWAKDSIEPVLDKYTQAFDMVKATQIELDRIKELKSTSDAKVEQARFILSQIEPIDPTVEDYEQLVSSLNRSENAEALARLTNDAYCAMNDEQGVLDNLNAAISYLDEASKYDESLNAGTNTLREATYLIEDVARDVVAYRDAIDLDVSALEFAQMRVASYQGLIRKFGPTIQDVVAAQDEARRTIALIDNADESLRIAQSALDEAEKALLACAEQLTEVRKSQVPKLCDNVNSILNQLEMGSANIECSIERLDRSLWTRNSPDKIEFLFKPSSNMQSRSLSRVASGGELSRIMLALHVVLGEGNDHRTLVFDEIDAGVGGATANALGEVLKSLSENHQVIVVTHLAQIASKANKQYVVEKSEDDGRAITQIHEVEGDAREAEIARMLSGTVTQTALEHARELLK